MKISFASFNYLLLIFIRMTIRNLKFCAFIVVFSGLFACGSSSQTTEVESTEQTTEEVTEVKEETKKEGSDLTIYQKSFLGLSPDTKITDYKGTLEKGLLQTGEGDFPIFNVKNDKGNTVAYFVPFGEKEDKVGSISVTSDQAKTEDGIKIGDTFGTLLQKYPDLKVFGSEIEGYTEAVVGNLGYKLDEQHYNYELKVSEVKKETEIIEITIK